LEGKEGKRKGQEKKGKERVVKEMLPQTKIYHYTTGYHTTSDRQLTAWSHFVSVTRDLRVVTVAYSFHINCTNCGHT